MYLTSLSHLFRNTFFSSENSPNNSLINNLWSRVSIIFDRIITQSPVSSVESSPLALSDSQGEIKILNGLEKQSFVDAAESVEAFVQAMHLEEQEQKNVDAIEDPHLRMSLAERFFQLVTIEGNEAFVTKTKAMIEKMTQTKLGGHLIHMIVNTDKSFKIKESKKGSYQKKELIGFCLFAKNSFSLTLDGTGVKKIEKTPKIVALFHEIVHMHHQNTSYAGEFLGRIANGTSLDKDMHDAEEELTISGKIQGGGNFSQILEDFEDLSLSPFLGMIEDPLNENAFRTELGYNKRVNHVGIRAKKGEHPEALELLGLLYDQTLMSHTIDLQKDSPDEIMYILRKEEDIKMIFHFIKKNDKNFFAFLTTSVSESQSSKIKFFQKIFDLFVQNEVKIRTPKMFKELNRFGYKISFELLNFSFPPSRALSFYLESLNPQLEQVQELLARGAELPPDLINRKIFYSISWLEFLKLQGQLPSIQTLHFYLRDWMIADLSAIKWIVNQGIKPTEESIRIAQEIQGGKDILDFLSEELKQ